MKAWFIRFIVRSDHPSRTRCTGVVTSLRILGEEGRLPEYYGAYALELFELLNEELPIPTFKDNRWPSDGISWFKDTPSAQRWVSCFRDIVAILEDSDIDVAMLTTDNPGRIIYEDDLQVVAISKRY